jgi:predicted O-methyltransferase YrrM
MKVVIGLPMLEGGIKAKCHQSLVAAYHLLNGAKIPHEEFIVESCPYLPVARNTLVAMFLADPEATDLFFIDSDVGFDASAVLRILERPEGIVGGIYPLKRDAIGYPVKVKMVDGIPIGRDGLIEAELMPVGFARLKRIVFESLSKAYPEMKYESSVVEMRGAAVSEAYDFFGMGVFGSRFRTEDYAFCQRWRDIGGQLWVYPDIEFEHVGSKAFVGNYHRFLLHQPGGAREYLDITRALAIDGWMTPAELEWLAEQASKYSPIVELGSHYGRSTRALADNTIGTVFAIDNWQGPQEVEMTADARANIWPAFCENVRDHIDSGRVVPIFADHSAPLVVEFLATFHPEMIFIDGAHDCDSVSRDLRNALKRIAPGGLLCGHDLDRKGVREAVHANLPDAQKVEGTSIWYWQAPAN